MESPGSLPLPMNTVWFGGTVVNNTVCGGIPQNTIAFDLTIGQRAADAPTINCNPFRPQYWAPSVTIEPVAPAFKPLPMPTAIVPAMLNPLRLSDADVERIAQRVAQLLREPKP